MSLPIPFTFTGGPGNKAKASEVNSNFQAVASKFTEGAGGIADGDISATAGIRGTKFSNVPGNRIPEDRFEDGAVSARALRSDATAGAANAAVGTSNHIKDGILLNRHLTPVGLAKLAVTVHAVAYSFAVGSLSLATAAVAPTVPFPVATYELLAIHIKNATGAVVQSATGNDGGTNWTSLVSAFASGAGSTTAAGTLVFVFIQRTAP